MKKILQPNFIIYVCILFGGLAGLVSNAPFFIIAPLVILGTGGSLYSLCKSNTRDQDADYLLEAQAKLFANAGLGNIYTKAFEEKLRKTGSCENASEILTKALEIDPNDKDAMIMLSSIYALDISFRQWADGKRDDTFRKTLSNVKNLAKRGIKLFPNEFSFYESLGMLLDAEGRHQDAQKEFYKSGKLRDDPFWRLPLSTSLLMSGKSDKALDEMKKIVDTGVQSWIVNFYYGRTLFVVGDYKNAEGYLLSAFKMRGFRIELLQTIEENYYWQAKLYKSVKFAVLKSFIFLSGGRLKKGLLFLAVSFVTFRIAIFGTLSKFLWLFFRKVPWLKNTNFLFTSPEEPEFTIGTTLIEKGYYKAAENLLRKVFEIRPSKGRIYMNLAICLFRQGKKKEALLACDSAIKLDPGNEAFQHNRRTFEFGHHKEGRIVNIPGN